MAESDQMKKIKQAVAEEHWQTVLNLIEPNVEKIQIDAQLNYFFVLSLFRTKHYVEGLKYANDAADFYLQNAQKRKLYFSLMLACQDFLDAHRFLEVLRKHHFNDLDQFEADLMKKENETREQSQTLNQRLKKFYHLGDLSIAEANKELEVAKQLPAAEYFQAAQFIFVDPFVHPLIRATVLENVVLMGQQKTVSYYWLDNQNHDVNLSNLKGILDNSVNQDLTNALQNKLADQDPIMLSGLLKEKDLYLSYVYPFAKQIFLKPLDWVNYWLDEYYGRAHQVTKATQSIEKWQTKFHNFTQQLIEDSEINK
ncbi:Hypothetical protein ADU72_0266 [Pediococcus damnosus]|uniref:TPR repeat-containing protein n=2 Tax=Pediococcus damnosus TaxID=51663 RepID=A0A0R2H121_9LACO|nr:hypothetical protein [Pediococcus damnosus]AMV59799.1 Hypothetical protein ADU69_0121 [Pediococcus damnosus]AMV61910.1 Hypothetical protein ADU70_0410 [Pediococcus damnosus]AMV64045.1 Hypothetical protein ADU71_0122 [Pediococcus damnosus]AMV66215.1 Hypothetical protein ADU72_0266 [Pediococcus damnosus]AMV68496.1 Hypothetical protein ADU73_0084 [Pediococcus damnosus]